MKLPVFLTFRPRRSPERPRFIVRVRQFFALLAWSLCCVVLGGVVYLLGLRVYHFTNESDFFAVRDVRVAGATEVLNQQVQDVISTLRDRGENNLITFNLERAQFQVQNLPRVREVEFHKVFPDTLVVDISERQPLTVANLGDLYWIDRDGVLLGRAEAVDVARMKTPLLTGLRGSQFYAGLHVSQPRLKEVLDAVDFMRQHAPELSEKFSEWNINSQNEITGILREGVEVRFGDRDPIDRLALLEQLFRRKGDLAQFTYFDLRFDSQIVYL